MSLKKYSEKRHFDQTPEPPPKAAPRSSHSRPLQFCVQRHHATRLHYDFRLEVDGALKSWAVPKGPTLDPSQKRLAMMVEDHPLEYGSFEGNIPKGNYGGGSVMLWDRGTYEVLDDTPADKQLERGDFKFRLSGEKLSGDFALVRIKRGKGNEWLLLKKKDVSADAKWDTEDHAVSVMTGRTQEEIARGLEPVVGEKPSAAIDDPPEQGNKKARTKKSSASRHPASSKLPLKKKASSDPDAVPGPDDLPGTRAPMPRDVSPMLAQLGKGEPPAGAAAKDWVYEIKWDGIRALCYIDAGKVRMVSRNGHTMDRQYPELSILPHHVHAKQAILDGEIAAIDDRGIPSFALLQRRITVADAGAIAALARSRPVVLFVFDLLYLDGHDLRGVPLLERKRLLKEILKPGDVVRYSEDFGGSGRELLAAAKEQGLEGVVGKRANSFYESRRTADWVKWKVTSSSEFIICGFTEGGRDRFGALVLGIYDVGASKSRKLVYAGNVGTGFDRKMIESIHTLLVPLITTQCPLEPEKGLPRAVTWTRPELVCEVKFSNWTEDRRLRAPVFLGLRPDIDPSECVLEQAAEQSAAEVRDHSNSSEHRAPERTMLLDASQAETILNVDGHRLKFTNLNKVFYPKEGYTKRDLLNYYDAVAALILPHLKDRPLSLKRYPNGIEAPFFFQKEVARSFPKWLHTAKADGIRYVVGDDRATLLFLVNLGCIDHNPWMSRVGSLDHPDYLLIDLDPQDCPYEKIVEAAILIRGKLDHADLESYPKTTGGDGLHIFVPLEPKYTYDQVRSFAEALSGLVAAERPDLFTTPRAVSRREKGRVYFDWMQIGKSKTISAPYVVRAYPGAPVATPLDWSEVTPRLKPDQFHIGNAVDRFDRVGDLFSGVLNHPQKLESAVDKLSRK